MALDYKSALFLCVVLLSGIEINASSLWNGRSSFFQASETEVNVQTSGESCHFATGVFEPCQAAKVVNGEDTDYFHVCPRDGDPCDPKFCYFTGIRPCCAGALLTECKSTSKLLLHETVINVTFYNVRRPGLSDTTCFVVEPTIGLCDEDCKLQCPKTPLCTNNTIFCDELNGNCICKEGFEPFDCCECSVGNDTHGWYKAPNGSCLPYCKQNCRTQAADGSCSSCHGGFEPPSCCNCPNGKTAIGGLCKCDGNFDPNGDCKEGYLAPDCCNCDPTGNDTHAFYEDDNGQCIPFCKLNCAVRGDNGCDTCNAGYVDEPECCDCDTQGNSTHAYYRTDSGECKPYCKSNCAREGTKGCAECNAGYASAPECCGCASGYEVTVDGICEEPKCEKDQTLYFLIDVSISNEYHKFCRLMTVAQLLVAAFNPSPSKTPNTEVSARVFSRQDMAPLEAFATTDNCNDIVSSKIPLLMEQYRRCKSGTQQSPPFCGDETYAIKGLDQISTYSETVTGQPEALIILTGGIISTKATDSEDPELGRIRLENAIEKLDNSGVTIRIAAQSDDEYDPGLLKYVSRGENALDNSNPIDLGVEIVNRLRAEGIICNDHADEIVSSILKTSEDNLDIYCKCIENRSGGQCQVVPGYYTKVNYEFPTCGGSLDFGISAAGANMQKDDSESLEEDILAAVEKVMKHFTE